MSMSFTTVLRILLLQAALCTLGVVARAAEFDLPDTIRIAPGERREIALRGTIEAGGRTRIQLRYTPSVVRILSARGGATSSQFCDIIAISTNIISSDTALATLSCPFSRPAVNDTVCFVTIEGVGGASTGGQITVDSVIAEDSSYQVTRVSGGLVVRTGIITTGASTSLAITGNYPNPFAERTRVVFVVPKEETVRLSMRTIQGRVVKTWSVDAVAGENAYDLTFLPSDAASGMYILTLESTHGVAYHSMRVKP